MTRTQTMVQLNDELVRQLDAEAERRGLSRSALIRAVLSSYLEELRKADIGHLIADGYRRRPQGVPDEWGDLASLTQRSTTETLQRLDREDRDAGAQW